MLVLQALADPVRREIVERLAAGEVGAGELAAAFPVSRPAVSRHLRLLREAGLVTSRVAGQERIYALDRRALAELDAWLERFRPLDARPLDARPSDAGPAEVRPTEVRPTGPAARLDALDTEMARGRRRRRADEGEPRGRSTG